MRHGRELFALAFALAGCAGTIGTSEQSAGRSFAPVAAVGEALVFPEVAAVPLAGAIPDAPPPLEVAEAMRPRRWWRAGLAGVELGAYDIRTGDFDEWFKTGTYYGVRYSCQIGLGWAASLQAGYHKSPTRVVGGEDLDFFPLRATLELGSHAGPSRPRWFVGAGGGYYVMEKRPSDSKIDLWPIELPPVSSEWTAHGVAGLEFRNESVMATRLEFGHAWLFDSRADMWTVSVTLSSQF